MSDVAEIERIFRSEFGRVLAYTIRAAAGDFDAAEEAVQEAFVRALQTWPRRGAPTQPSAWLARVAGRILVDGHRRSSTRDQSQSELESLMEERTDAEPQTIPDHRLGLIFACCHPALDRDARIGLILRAVGGLTSKEIARAFLSPETAMARRLGRAKVKVREAGIPFEVPSKEELPGRTSDVLLVIYLIFNEGYSASSGDSLVRRALCDEAIRLARVLSELLPSDPEVFGLLSLMLLHDSRRDARTDADGRLVLLEDQDRSCWNQGRIAEGLAALRHATSLARPGRYQIHAAIAAVHAESTSAQKTNWRTVVRFYKLLEAYEAGPVVRLNRIVAEAMVAGPTRGLELLEELASAGLDQYLPYKAARADLHRRAGQCSEALAAYREALCLDPNDAEARYFRRRIAEFAE